MKLKRVTALLMAGVMCLSFGGCGKKSSSKKKEEKLDYYKLLQEAEFDYIVSDIVMKDNVVYASYYKSDETGEEGSEDYSYKEIFGVVKYDMNTKEKTEKEIDTSNGYVRSMYFDKDGELVINGVQYLDSGKYEDITEITKNEALTDEPEDSEDKVVAGTDAEEPGDTSAEDSGEEDEGYSYIEVTYIYNTDLEQISVEKSEPITENYGLDMSENNEEMVYDTSVDNEGNYVKLVTKDGDKFYVKVEDSEGNEKSKIDLGDMYANRLIKMSNGSYVVEGWGDEGQQILKLDIEGEKLGDKFVDSKSLFNIQNIYPGEGNTLLMNLDGYLNICDGDTGKISKVFKYMDCDLNSDNVMSVFVVDEDTYGIIVVDYQNEKSELDLLTKQDKSEVVQKQEIHIATLYADDQLKQMAINFNKANDDYKMVVDEYFDSEVFSSETGYQDAIKRFNADITSEGGPDIIDLNAINIKQYSEKGIFEDITKYLANDSNLSEDSFVESVLDVYRDNGKLYAIPVSFSLSFIAGKKSEVGEGLSWTMDDFVNYANSLPEGKDVFADSTSDGLLYTMIAYNMDEYIDWKTGECNFNSDEFVELLELCSKYKSSEEFYADFQNDEDWGDESSEVTKIRNGKVALQRVWMSQVEEYQIEKLTFGDDFTIKGYPTSDGNGVAIESQGISLAINAKSKYKDIAWEFISQLYTYEGSDYYYGFPSVKTELDKMFDELKDRETQTAPDGTEYYTMWSFGDDAEFYITVPTDEEISQIKKLINSADKVASYADEEIISIINEESEGFFEGEKSAREVADVIQSRVSIYVKENK